VEGYAVDGVVTEYKKGATHAIKPMSLPGVARATPYPAPPHSPIACPALPPLELAAGSPCTGEDGGGGAFSLLHGVGGLLQPPGLTKKAKEGI
jgi:hypothetical protein